MSDLKSPAKNPVEMTADELEQLLKEKKQAERLAQKTREKKYESKKQDFIRAMIAKMSYLHQELSDLKKEVVTRGHELHDTMYEVYGKEPKELKQFSLDSEDGKFRLNIESAERQSLDETATVHIQTIKEVMHRKFANRNQKMYKIMNGLLIKNKAGDYDERMVAKLRAFEDVVDDPDFGAALDNLAKAYYTYGTAIYVRGYIKDAETNRWELIPLQFSSL